MIWGALIAAYIAGAATMHVFLTIRRLRREIPEVILGQIFDVKAPFSMRRHRFRARRIVVERTKPDVFESHALVEELRK